MSAPYDIRFIDEPRIRTFGGWYQITRVAVDGHTLDGHIQTRRRHKRTDTITIYGQYCVRGADYRWLMSQQTQPERHA